MGERWWQAFPSLDALDAASRDLLFRAARRVSVPAGAAVFRPGNPCESYVFVIDGTVRVQQVAEDGREIVLYRLERGETCVLTTACLLAREDYAAEALAETAVEAAILPGGVFRELLHRSAPFRDFVFATFGMRIVDFMQVIEEVAFRRIDLRLARRLLERSGGADRLALTHQELAVELGTAREVVSRQLKEFERRGWVGLGRGHVAIRDRGAIEAFVRRADAP